MIIWHCYSEPDSPSWHVKHLSGENDIHLETMETMTGKPLPEVYVQAQLRYIKAFISAHKPEVREHLYSLGLLKSKKEHLMISHNDEIYEKLFSWFLHCIDHIEGDFGLEGGFIPYQHGEPLPLWPVLNLKISGSDSATGREIPFSFPVYYFPHLLKECIRARVNDFSGEKSQPSSWISVVKLGMRSGKRSLLTRRAAEH